MSDLADLQSKTSLPTRSVRLCLNGDLVTERDEVGAALRDAVLADAREGAPSDESLSAPSRVGLLQQRADDIDARMKDATVEFVFRALSRAAFTAIEDDHPASKETGEYPPAFWAALISAALESHSLTPDEAGTFLDESLTQGQVAELCNAAIEVNLEKGEVPFSAAGFGVRS